MVKSSDRDAAEQPREVAVHEEVRLRVELSSHSDALQRMTALLHRKAAQIEALTFLGDVAYMTLRVMSDRTPHVVASLRKEVQIVTVDIVTPECSALTTGPRDGSRDERRQRPSPGQTRTVSRYH